MACMSSVTVRVEPEDKRQVSEIVEYYGFDLSSVTRAFYKQIIREHRIPLDLGSPQPNTDSVESIREAERVIADRSARFSNADDMLTALKA
ncbi:type II toxin-antitoxin system RelB/DinJ family antitoxin [Olsenella sp. YH-ols2217]|uniref:Type II toxin-antitoxin system RelB/DinJ family antitoxin n=1 Tax=Kribbibacterium absianum TaxID=3044210 RepID=A0ABT6ZKE0_9ACTN|nr:MULTISPECIES: type II toxin-antitoxin system RelB/DinJ family antitoxin [unclassified Olsenella]MDJ1122509.1 type II toxin-antitoxin system RelB/DinJ family antitoxin [Olsenella sp. YH-ols2216]MDJ1129531.1 type II toxin-antitoxin system RelB/DinJ family antitoxin [Olsenella sp. YH-ols2217]